MLFSGGVNNIFLIKRWNVFQQESTSHRKIKLWKVIVRKRNLGIGFSGKYILTP